jgi:hypothetical protein
MNNYKLYVIAFLINAAILATISSVSIEMRFAIDHSPPPYSKVTSLSTFFDKIFYYLRILPYKFADSLGLRKHNEIPEGIKFLFTFLITFIIALCVYHFFLGLLGYDKLYKYFFGNFTIQKR